MNLVLGVTTLILLVFKNKEIDEGISVQSDPDVKNWREVKREGDVNKSESE